MKVEEYIRTKDGIIDKVIIEYKGKCASPTCNRKHVSCEKNYYDEDNIVKSSPNIIDLIEVGDYVNGEKVLEVLIDRNMSRIKTELSTFFNNEIKSIVTKESMESVTYYVK